MRFDVDKVLVVQTSCVHQASHTTFVFVQFFVLVVHGSFCLSRHNEFRASIEEIAEPINAIATENAKDVTLLLSEFGRSFSTECSEIVSQERLNTGKTEMGEPRAIIQQCMDSLGDSVRLHQKGGVRIADIPPWLNGHSNSSAPARDC